MPQSNHFLMANKLAHGKLEETIRAMRDEGQSFDAISLFLYRKWDIRVTGKGINKWFKTFEEADA
jgi:hypothetical protein